MVDITDDSDHPLVNELQMALEKDHFRLQYQPKVHARSGKIVGVEALIRWEHPEKGMISPMDFIPLAEKSGLILPIGEWVLRTACQQNKSWQDDGIPPMIMAVNLSARQLYQPELVQLVQEILVETNLAPEYLELEITESMMMDVQRILPIMKKLKSIGVRLSLDDFGTGYSSLQYLKEFPIDEIKIDQSFVRVCTSDQKDATIVKTIIAMAHQLKLDVVAEGVETKEQLIFLQQHLCDKAQGYFFSRPISAEELSQNFSAIEKIAKQEGIPQELNRQKWLEEALENARQELQDAVRQQQGMIFKFKEKNGKFIHTLSDGELLYKLGLTPDVLIGRELHEVIPYEEAERKSVFYRRAWEGEEGISYEGKINGVSYLASLRPIRRNGKVVEVIASGVDITERIESEERFQKIAEYSLSGVIIYRDEEILYANQSAMKILQAKDVVGKSLNCYLHKDSPALPNYFLEEVDGQKELPITEMKFKRYDGEIIEIDMATVPITYDRKPAVLALFRDETKRKAAERIQEESIKKLEDIDFALNESSIVAITNQRGIIQFVNEKFCEVSQYKKEELIGQNHKILNSGNHPKSFFKEMWKTIGQGRTWRGEIQNKTKQGVYYWVDTTIVPFFNEKGKPYQYVSIRTEITERKRIEEALRLSEERYRLITEQMTDLVSIIDRNGFCKFASPSHTAVLGYPIEYLKQKDMLTLVHLKDQKRIQIQFKKMIESKADCIFEVRYKNSTGSWVWLESKANPIFDAAGNLDQFLIVSRDISERKMYEEKLTYLAYHDMLTGLFNRRYFLDSLEEHLEEAKRHQRKMSVIYIDLDGFKQVNDAHGHDVGDETLKKFVGRVQNCLDERTLFARQGGDEFTILMPDIKEEQEVIDLANQIIHSLQEEEPFYRMTASLGISFYPKDGTSSRKLLEYADKALYEAKEDGKNKYKTYSS